MDRRFILIKASYRSIQFGSFLHTDCLLPHIFWFRVSLPSPSRRNPWSGLTPQSPEKLFSQLLMRQLTKETLPTTFNGYALKPHYWVIAVFKADERSPINAIRGARSLKGESQSRPYLRDSSFSLVAEAGSTLRLTRLLKSSVTTQKTC